VLVWAWSCCRANGGSSGVDGQSFAGIEAKGVEAWLDQLAKELKEKTYRRQAVRRVLIPKPGGKQRPLGIPTIKDRVAQMAAVIRLEAIVEADLTEEQYAYRPQRSAHDAVNAVHELQMAVAEEDGKGGKRRTTVNKDSGRGTPQGAPISPLLANLYMRRFLLGWKQAGWDRKLKARIVNYADDFVILCRRKAEQAQEVMEVMMRKLKLRVNQQKTRICRVPEESFDFLGYTMGQCYRAQTGTAYIGTKPSKKGVARICEKISQMTQRKRCWKETEELVGELNLVVKGWGNYFRLGSVSKAYRVVDSHTRHRLRQWLCHKHKIRGSDRNRFWDEYLYQKLGLFRLERFSTNLPWAKAT
jgi:RNA-directed DNA polymerase